MVLTCTWVKYAVKSSSTIGLGSPSSGACRVDKLGRDGMRDPSGDGIRPLSVIGASGRFDGMTASDEELVSCRGGGVWDDSDIRMTCVEDPGGHFLLKPTAGPLKRRSAHIHRRCLCYHDGWTAFIWADLLRTGASKEQYCLISRHPLQLFCLGFSSSISSHFMRFLSDTRQSITASELAE
jgi:hypothetical protein